MLRKTLTLGMVFILALSLLVVSMITCFTYDAQADDWFWCVHKQTGEERLEQRRLNPDRWRCTPYAHHHTGE